MKKIILALIAVFTAMGLCADETLTPSCVATDTEYKNVINDVDGKTTFLEKHTFFNCKQEDSVQKIKSVQYRNYEDIGIASDDQTALSKFVENKNCLKLNTRRDVYLSNKYMFRCYKKYEGEK